MSHFGGPLLAASWPNVAAVALDGVQKQMRAAPNIRSSAVPVPGAEINETTDGPDEPDGERLPSIRRYPCHPWWEHGTGADVWRCALVFRFTRRAA